LSWQARAEQLTSACLQCSAPVPLLEAQMLSAPHLPHGDKETKRPWGNGQSDSGPWGRWTTGQWDIGIKRTGQGDNAQLDIRTLGPGRRTNGAMGHWTMSPGGAWPR
jgi:hypothetical protein